MLRSPKNETCKIPKLVDIEQNVITTSPANNRKFRNVFPNIKDEIE